MREVQKAQEGEGVVKPILMLIKNTEMQTSSHHFCMHTQCTLVCKFMCQFIQSENMCKASESLFVQTFMVDVLMKRGGAIKGTKIDG